MSRLTTEQPEKYRVAKMAEAVGTDLSELEMRGQLDIEDLNEAYVRCAGCLHPGDCDDWLNLAAARKGELQPPEYCQNAKFFADLPKS